METSQPVSLDNGSENLNAPFSQLAAVYKAENARNVKTGLDAPYAFFGLRRHKSCGWREFIGEDCINIFVK